jgi:hypothetical protein
VSERTAYNLLDVDDKFGGAKLANFANIHRSILYLLAAPSTPEPCGRRGRYNVAKLIEQYGDAKLTELRHILANCPKALSWRSYRRVRLSALAGGGPSGAGLGPSPSRAAGV